MEALMNAMTETRGLLSNNDADPTTLIDAAAKLDTLSLSTFERAYNAKGASSGSDKK